MGYKQSQRRGYFDQENEGESDGVHIHSRVTVREREVKVRPPIDHTDSQLIGRAVSNSVADSSNRLSTTNSLLEVKTERSWVNWPASNVHGNENN